MDLFQRFLNKAQGFGLAAQEAVPALLGGLVGRDRTDTKVNPLMEQGLVDAYDNMRRRGGDKIIYEDYGNNPGGIGAKYTFGTVSPASLTYDSKGNVTGIQAERYDTDKTVGKALNEGFQRGLRGDIGAAIYKPFEALLAATQDRGLTTHNVAFTSNPVTAMPKPMEPVLSEYTVKGGDNLTAISKELGTTVENLMLLNGIKDGNVLHIGQKLKIQ
jgi:LysM repeat protein